MSLPYLIWLDDAQDPLTEDMLYDDDHDDLVMGCERNFARGELPHLSVEIENPGWSLWEIGQPRACCLLESPDGTLASAIILGRGTVRSLPAAVQGGTVTLDVECYPDEETLREAKESAAAAVLGVPLPSEYDPDGTLSDDDPTAENVPYVDWLLGRPQLLADAVGLTRHGYWHHDPVTHAVTWKDHAERRRVLNLADAYDTGSLSISPGQGAVSEVTCNLVTAFTINARGECEIGPWIGGVTSLTGYGGSADGSLAANAGWNLGSPTTRVIEAATGDIPTGRAWRATYRRVYYVQTPVAGSSPPTTTTNTRYGASFDLIHREYVDLVTKDIRFVSWLAAYTYSQPVRETWRMRLRFPIQPGATGPKAVLELGDVETSDPHTIAGLANLTPLDPEQTYAKDDAVIEGGVVYRASVAGLKGSEFYLARRVGRYTGVKTFYERDPRWIALGISPPLTDPAAVEFGPTPRGLAMVASQFLRMSVQGLDRLQEWQATLTCLRQDLLDLAGAVALDTVDGIRVLLPGRQDDPGMKAAIGYLMRAVERWHGDEGETVELTLAFPPGSGADAVASPAAAGAYGAPEMVEAEYLDQGTEHLTAGPHIEWRFEADDLKLPVVPAALSDPGYSLGGSYTKRNQLPEQLAAWHRAAATQGKPPDGLDMLGDTMVEVLLRPLVSAPVIEREFRAVGDMTWCPRGVRLTEPGEP